jgi:phosphoacetylglucosamine mutase
LELIVIQSSWEKHATVLANAASDEEVYDACQRIVQDLSFNGENKSRVVFARDTRASGPRLVDALVAALTYTGTDYTDHGLLTTPQLHYVTRCINTRGTPYDYGEPTEVGYYEKLAAAFKKAMQGKRTDGPLIVDCANGVGGPKLGELVKYLPTASEGGVDIKIVNDDVLQPDLLNHQVGNMTPNAPSGGNTVERLSDGSAERIMSRPSNEPPRPLKPADLPAVAPWMATPIGSSIISSTRTTRSTSSMEIASRPWRHPSSATSFAMRE